MIALAEWLPRAGDEAFKYTSFATVARRDYEAPSPVAVDPAALPAPFGRRILFIDGLLTGGKVPVGATQENVGATLWSRSDPLKAPDGANALRTMNAGLATACLTLDIPADTDAGIIELLFVTSAHDGQVASHPQVRISVGAHARATLVERHVALGDTQDFTNLVTGIDCAAGARVTHLLVQEAASRAALASGVYVELAADAHFDSHAVQLGGALVRTDIAVRLAGRGARCDLHGFHLCGMRQHIDTHTRLDHLVPDTASAEHYRAVVDRGGRSVFNGKVVVAEGADRTDAQQFNANLLLAEQAEVDTKPELEIYADDVKCAHGATVGKLDEDALFYLRTRGIGEDAARSVLVWAFADTVLSRLPLDAARATIEEKVLGRLPDAERIQEFR